MFHESLAMLLKDSRLKIKRANKHIADIEARIVLLHETDTATVDINPDTGGESLKHDFTDAPAAFDDIALMVGDAVHNLNCALDYTWFQTIERLVPAAVDDRAKFPVRKAIEELQGWLTKTEINLASPNLYSFMVDVIKPCDGGCHLARSQYGHQRQAPPSYSSSVCRAY